MDKKEYFNQAIKSLKKEFPRLKARINQLETIQKSSLKLFKWILLGDPKKRIYEYHFFLNGILAKAMNLSESFAIELDRQNPYSLNMILRSNYESLASLNYFRKHKDKRKQLIWGDKYKKKKTENKTESINVLTMLGELDKDTPNWLSVVEDYEEMTQVIHPNRKSHLANIKPQENSDSKFSSMFTFSSYCNLDEKGVEMYLNSQINLFNQILKNVKLIDDIFCKANKIKKEMPKIKGEK